MGKYSKNAELRDYDALQFGPRRGQGQARQNEAQAWYKYLVDLRRVRIVDPACGSGVFLVMAFDYLRAEYERANKKVLELAGTSGTSGKAEDIDREILSGTSMASTSTRRALKSQNFHSAQDGAERQKT